MLKQLVQVIAITLGGALTVASPANADQTAYDNIPLEEGNLWVFVTDSAGYLRGETGSRTVHVEREWNLGDGWYANRVNGLYTPESSVIMYDHVYDSNFLVHDGSDWTHALRFAGAAGEPWSMRANSCDAFDVERYDNAGTTVTVPAGDFENPIGFSFTHTPDPAAQCGDPTLLGLLTAPGVGPIAFSTTKHKGHLMYARVNGNVVAAAPNVSRELDGVETTLLVAEDSLVHPTFNCVTAPCQQPTAALVFSFVVRNVSDADISFSFSNGQAFEVDLFSGNDNVRRYSDGRGFTMALWDFSLAPGEARVFHGQMPLSQFDGDSPVVGQLQIVGYLVNTEGASKLSLDVEASL